MSGITTHILDVANGVPAAGVAVRLERRAGSSGWQTVAEKRTDSDGRVRDLHPQAPETGHYRLTFGSGDYWKGRGEDGFHPEVAVMFEVRDVAQHYHVPLLCSPWGYTTYRGS